MDGTTDAARANTKFGKAVAERRVALGLTQAELSRRAKDSGLDNFHPTTISRIESGDQAVRLHEALTLARVLETTLEELTTDARTEIQVLRLASDRVLSAGANVIESVDALLARQRELISQYESTSPAARASFDHTIDKEISIEGFTSFCRSADRDQLLAFFLDRTLTVFGDG